MRCTSHCSTTWCIESNVQTKVSQSALRSRHVYCILQLGHTHTPQQPRTLLYFVTPLKESRIRTHNSLHCNSQRRLYLAGEGRKVHTFSTCAQLFPPQMQSCVPLPTSCASGTKHLTSCTNGDGRSLGRFTQTRVYGSSRRVQRKQLCLSVTTWWVGHVGFSACMDHTSMVRDRPTFGTGIVAQNNFWLVLDPLASRRPPGASASVEIETPSAPTLARATVPVCDSI